MKKYIKPIIEDETIELEDVIAASGDKPKLQEGPFDFLQNDPDGEDL